MFITDASRPTRIPIVRLFLSSHRMIIETGRWKRWERNQRFCTACFPDSADRPGICRTRCTHLEERCIGTEEHYLWHCPITNHWELLRTVIYDKLNYDIGSGHVHRINRILDISEQDNKKWSIGQLKILNYHFSRMSSDLLNDTAGIFLPFNVDA